MDPNLDQPESGSSGSNAPSGGSLNIGGLRALPWCQKLENSGSCNRAGHINDQNSTAIR